MLEGDKVKLKLMEKSRLGLLHNYLTDPFYIGNYETFPHITQGELEKQFRYLENEQWWWIETKELISTVGFLANKLRDRHQEIRFLLAQDEVGKGFAVEAVRILVDHLFLNLEIARIQAEIHLEDLSTQKVFEENGFVREGILRKKVFSKGSWRDSVLYSRIRDEWTAFK